jgi:hypothetical protein
VQGGLGRAGEQGRGSAGVWGATPARRGVAPVDGEAWLRSAASVGERGERDRESSGREREGEAWPFIERERERRGCRGEREGDRPSMAPLGREHGGGGRERVAVVSGLGGEWARVAGSTGRAGRASALRRRRGEGDEGGRRERGPGWVPPSGEREGRGNGARPAGLAARVRVRLFFFSFFF